MVSTLADYYDFAVNEECIGYNECGPLKKFIGSNKGNYIFKIIYYLKNYLKLVEYDK